MLFLNILVSYDTFYKLYNFKAKIKKYYTKTNNN